MKDAAAVSLQNPAQQLLVTAALDGAQLAEIKRRNV
jgi:hypothetical protein